MKKLQNKKTKLGALGYAISGSLFIASISIPVTSEIIYALLCFSTSLVSWGIYDRGVRNHKAEQELRDQQNQLLNTGLFREIEVEGVKHKTARIKSRGIT